MEEVLSAYVNYSICCGYHSSLNVSRHEELDPDQTLEVLPLEAGP